MLDRLTADVEKFEGQIAAIQTKKQHLVDELNKLEAEESRIAPIYTYAKGLMDDVKAANRKRVEAANKANKAKKAAEDAPQAPDPNE